MAVALPMPGRITTLEGRDTSDNVIGIRLLEAPVNRRADPRAQVYIVDHLAPGAVIKRRVLISNKSRTKRHVEVFPGAASIDNNAFSPTSGRATNELTSWTSVDKGAIDLAAGTSAKVLVTIAVDRIAAQGERYGVIWAQTSGPANPSGGVTMTSRVGIRVYLDIGPGGEAPSNFEVDSLTPARMKDGRPEILAAVHNTGGRAVDMAGELSLSDGPGGVSAGPFPATVGTTLLKGHSGSVQVLLDPRLPDGPWKVRLTLRSGAIERTVTATITFPAVADTMGQPVTLASWAGTHRFLLIGLAGALIAALSLFVVVRRRLGRRARSVS